MPLTWPGKARFRYKLEGWDDDWVGAGETAIYTRIAPGKYQFRVTACSEDGPWNDTGASVAVTVLPAWWQTTWFKVLLFCAGCGLLFALHKWRVHALKHQCAAFKSLSRRFIAAQEEERKRLAGELHDGLGQYLLVIKNLAAMGMRSDAECESDKERFETISKLSSMAVAEIRQMSRALRPFELGRLGLGRAVAGLIKASAESSGIKFDTDVDDLDGVFGGESEIHFYRIIQESVANVLKHSKAKHAQVRVKRDSLQVRACIRDDGC